MCIYIVVPASNFYLYGSLFKLGGNPTFPEYVKKYSL